MNHLVSCFVLCELPCQAGAHFYFLIFAEFRGRNQLVCTLC
jgi:hypothetical protein